MGVSVRHACGHDRVHDVIGTFASDHDRQATRLARRPCEDCETSRLEESLLAVVADVQGLVLTDLSGSFRQVNWATGIRAKRLIELHKASVDAGLLRHLGGLNEAQWWIASRALKRDAFVAQALVRICG